MKHKGKPRTGRVQFLFLGFLCGPQIVWGSSGDLLAIFL